MRQETFGFVTTGNRCAGVDEVGRGPLAGPVVAAAVILSEHVIEGVADSKTLSPKRRGALAERIRAEALAWSLGRAEVEEIDRLNIRMASLLAMERAVAGLAVTPDYAWIDGRDCPRLACPMEAVIGGDGRVPAIAAASIIAKEARDAEMVALADSFPGYGFERHKGYGSQVHLEALARLGPCVHHRRSFAPVRRALSRAAEQR